MDTEKITLTEHQLTYYETFGFIVLRGVLTQEELSAINVEFERGLEAAHRYNPGIESSRQLRWSNLSPDFPVTASLLEDSRICGVAEQLIGEDAVPIFSNGNRWVTDTGWHSDTQHTSLRGVKIACYLQPVDGESGALRFVPGSHKSQLNSELASLLEEMKPDLRDVPAHICESEPGDIIAFDNRLYHAAAGTSTDKRQLTMNFVEHAKSPAAEKEFHELGDILRNQYSRLNAPLPFFAFEWAANSKGNARRQRTIDWLRSVGLLEGAVSRAQADQA